MVTDLCYGSLTAAPLATFAMSHPVGRPTVRNDCSELTFYLGTVQAHRCKQVTYPTKVLQLVF